MERGGTSSAAGGRTLTLDVHTTTGGSFALAADARSSVDHLKKLVSRKLKVPKERICLLHRERQLRDGTLEENGLSDGSKIILLPSVETGLLTQRPENSVMQALESLNDSQVNDFLSGKSPLNLTMRLGDHMMLIQLQLSTYPGGGVSTSTVGKSRLSSSHRTPSKSTRTSVKIPEPAPATSKPSTSREKLYDEVLPSCDGAANVSGSSTESPSKSSTDSDTKTTPVKEVNRAEDLKSLFCKQDFETLQNAFEIFKSFAEMQENIENIVSEAPCSSTEKTNCISSKYAFDEESNSMDVSTYLEQSPIKSLSNLVSSPLKSSLTSSYSPITLPISSSVDSPQKEDKPPPKFVPLPSSLKSNLISSIVGEHKVSHQTDRPVDCPIITDPIAANLTSCLCSSYVCASNCNHMDATSSAMDVSSINSALDDYKPSESTIDDSKPSVSSGSQESSPEKSFLSTSSQTTPVPKSCKNKRLHYLLHKTSKSGNQPIQSKPKAFMQSVVNKHIKKKMQQCTSSGNNSNDDLALPSTSKMETNVRTAHNQFDMSDEPSTSKATKDDLSKLEPHSTMSPISDTNSLVEASKNLTQTLKKLSKEVLTNKVDLANEETTRPKIGQGAVIESMKHHGKGIYSGTFSGTLNPALQDRFGRPKRDISTIIHILNDLLCATPPQYRRGARITFEPTHNAQPITRTKQREFKHSSCDAENGSDECECNKCSNSSNLCPYGECNGHYTTPAPSTESAYRNTDNCNCKRTERNVEECSCGYSADSKSCCSCKSSEVEEEPRKAQSKCTKCHTATTLALDNSKTKCKLDQLRLVMQQKKQRREARKIKTAPYPTSSSSAVIIGQSDAQSVITEEIETLA